MCNLNLTCHVKLCVSKCLPVALCRKYQMMNSLDKTISYSVPCSFRDLGLFQGGVPTKLQSVHGLKNNAKMYRLSDKGPR